MESSLWGWFLSCPTRSTDETHHTLDTQGLLAQSLQSCGLSVTQWTIARQSPLSMGFSRQECWRGLPCPLPGDLPHPGIKPTSLVSPSLAGGFLTTKTTWEALFHLMANNNGEGNGIPLQYSCLESPVNGRAWWAAVQGVAKSPTQLSDFTFTFHFHALEKEMATHSSVLAWRIPGTGEPGGLPSTRSHRVGHD